MSKYLLIVVTMSTFQEGEVNVISVHDTISECHMALTTRGFESDNPMEQTFCLITEEGVDWRIDNG